MYDAIVVGARCAGSPVAMHLAGKGYNVLLTDRAMFPSDTISTHMIWSPGLAYLKGWGLSEAVAGSNDPAIRELSFDVGEVARDLRSDGVALITMFRLGLPLSHLASAVANTNRFNARFGTPLNVTFYVSQEQRTRFIEAMADLISKDSGRQACLDRR